MHDSPNLQRTKSDLAIFHKIKNFFLLTTAKKPDRIPPSETFIMKKIFPVVLALTSLTGAAKAQYYPQSIPGPQYAPPAFFQGSTGGPVVVPPTIIQQAPPKCAVKKMSIFLIFDTYVQDGSC